jgi:hypothetical protein
MKKYKLKIIDIKTNHVRFKELNLTDEKLKQLKTKINIVENGYKLLDVWEV